MQGTIQYVNDPKQPGGKYGNVKLSDGTFIFVPVNLLSLFRGTEGKFAEITTKSQTWGQGDEAKPVTIATAGPKPAANGGAGATTGWTGSQRGPATQASYTSRSAAPKDDKEARQIFVTGVVGRAMGSGKFVASEIPVLAQSACEAYDQHLGAPKPKPTPPPPATTAVEGGDFFNDEIPDHMLEPDGR